MDSIEVFIHAFKEFPLYTLYLCRQFGGFASDEKWVAEAVALGESMQKEHVFDDSYYITSGYNSPFKLFNRRNEVWFVKKNSE